MAFGLAGAASRDEPMIQVFREAPVDELGIVVFLSAIALAVVVVVFVLSVYKPWGAAEININRKLEPFRHSLSDRWR